MTSHTPASLQARNERRSVARQFLAYPASRSAAIIVLPTVDHRSHDVPTHPAPAARRQPRSANGLQRLLARRPRRLAAQR